MYYLGEEELKELKSRIDESAKWFLDLMLHETKFEGTINDLIDAVVPFVQMKLQYCTSVLDADRTKSLNVSRLQGRLSSDFFLETQRILTNCAKSLTPILELNGEFTYYNYHFQYSNGGFFYYVDDSQPKRLIVEGGLINMVATLGDWHSPFFEAFLQPYNDMNAEKTENQPLQDNSNYQMLFRMFLHRWLRDQMKIHSTNSPIQQSKNGSEQSPKPLNPIPKRPQTIEDVLVNPAYMIKFSEALHEMECLDSEGRFIGAKNSGKKKFLAALYHIMITNSLIKVEYATMSQLDMTLCFQNTFKCKISQPTLGGNKSNKSEEYRDLYGLIFEKKKN